MTREEILKQYEEARELQTRANKLVEDWRQKLAVDCKHEYAFSSPWEHDNGYGRQTKMVGKFCPICRCHDRWNRGQFRKEYG